MIKQQLEKSEIVLINSSSYGMNRAATALGQGRMWVPHTSAPGWAPTREKSRFFTGKMSTIPFNWPN